MCVVMINMVILKMNLNVTPNRRMRTREEATIGFRPHIFEWIEGNRGHVSRSGFVNAIIEEKMHRETA